MKKQTVQPAPLPSAPGDCFRSPAAAAAARSMTHRWIVARSMEYFRKAHTTRQALRTPAQVRAYLGRMRRLFRERLGGLPPRTPLRPRVLGKIQRPKYVLEKLVFESQPALLVSANLYLPRGLDAPAAGVVVAMGHADDAKAYPEYQCVCQALALNGLVVLAFDPIGQGERFQFPDRRAFKSRIRFCVNEHGTLSWRCELLGLSLGGLMIRDSMAALDYLAGRPEVDARRLAVTGCSGGGTQTAFVAALDRRLKAAVPNSFLTERRCLVVQESLLYDPEQVQHGLIRDGLDHAELIGLAAPAATLVQGGLQDRGFDPAGTRRSVAAARKWFGLLGLKDRLALQQEDLGHGYFKPFRAGTLDWLALHLQGRRSAFKEPRLKTEARRALWCAKSGNVLELGSRTLLDLLREQAAGLRRKPAISAAALGTVLGLKPAALAYAGRARPAGCARWRGWKLERFLIQGQRGIAIPAVVMRPHGARALKAVVVASERGKQWELDHNPALAKWLSEGRAVVLADLRGLGETRQTRNLWSSPTPHWCYTIGHEGFLQEWLLQLGDSLLAARTRDLAAVLAFARRRLGVRQRNVLLFARGVAAWSAAALCRFRRPGGLALADFLASFEEVFDCDVPKVEPGYVVHGGMRVFDLPELLASLKELPLWIARPLDGRARPLPESLVRRRFKGVRKMTTNTEFP